MMRPLTDREKRTIRLGATALALYLVLFFGWRIVHALEATRQRAGVRRELLAKPDRHRVLKVRAAGLHDVIELLPLRDERVTGIGGAAITEAVSDVTGRSADEIWAGADAAVPSSGCDAGTATGRGGLRVAVTWPNGRADEGTDEAIVAVP